MRFEWKILLGIILVGVLAILIYKYNAPKIQPSPTITSKASPTTDQTYTDQTTGLTFSYPSNVIIASDTETEFSAESVDQFRLTVNYQKISDLEKENPLPFQITETVALDEQKALARGEFGVDNGAYTRSPKSVLKTLDGINVKSEYSTSFFDSCDVSLIKVGTFYHDGFQFTLALQPDKNKVMPEYPRYFNKSDCSDETDNDTSNDFYSWIQDDEVIGAIRYHEDIQNGTLAGSLKSWFDLFDDIITSVHFN